MSEFETILQTPVGIIPAFRIASHIEWLIDMGHMDEAKALTHRLSEEQVWEDTACWRPWHPEEGIAVLERRYDGRWGWSTTYPLSVHTPAYECFADSCPPWPGTGDRCPAVRLNVLRNMYPITVDGVTKWNYNM